MEPLTALVEKFIVARTADGRAPHTILDYRRVLAPFAQRCGAPLTRDSIRDYVAHLRTLGWKEGTVAIHIRNLRAFLRWLCDEGYTPDNLAAAVKAPRQVTRIEIPITPDEIRRLLSTCDPATFHGRRDCAIILTLFDAGLRCGELVALQADRWRSEAGCAGSYLLVYASKTKTARFCILGETTTQALRGYMNLRGEPGPVASLFCNAHGGALKTQAISSMLKRRADLAGLEHCRVHPHIFRKSFATAFLDNGGDAERLRVLAGWSSMEMVRVYADSSLRRLQEVHRRAGPVDQAFNGKR